MSGALGRHVEHDPASRGYEAARATTLVTTLHVRHCPPFDQGELGSCTGNAIAGLLMTSPVKKPSWAFTEKDAVRFYRWATHHDSVPGAYPPDDTGSSGLAAAKAAKHYGYISAYRHAFGLQHALEALVLQPVIVGVNWYDSFDDPGTGGFVQIAPQAEVRGGHEFELVGLDVTAKTVRACNSWGPDWADGGYFSFSWATFDRLLSEQGDCTTVTT